MVKRHGLTTALAPAVAAAWIACGGWGCGSGGAGRHAAVDADGSAQATAADASAGDVGGGMDGASRGDAGRGRDTVQDASGDGSASDAVGAGQGDARAGRGSRGLSPWSRFLDAGGEEEIEAVVSASDGTLVFAGVTAGASGEDDDAWLLALAPDGTLRWSVTVGSPEDDEAFYDVKRDPAGGFVAAGMTQSWGEGGADVFVVKFDAEGGVQWARTYGGAHDEQGWSVLPVAAAQGEPAGYAVAGATRSWGAGGADYWVLRLDEMGEVVWQEAVGGAGEDGGGSDYGDLDVRVLPGRKGGFVLVSETQTFGAGGADVWAVGLDAAGHVRWQYAYGGPQDDSTWSAVALPGGGVFVPAVTESFGPDHSGDVWGLWLDAEGQVVAERVYALGGLYHEALCATPLADGGVLVGGWVDRETDWGYTLLRVASDGALAWGREYGESWDWPNAAVELSDGSFAVAGVAWGGDPHPDVMDFWALRLPPDGTLPSDCSPVRSLDLTVQPTHASVTETSGVVTPTNAKARSIEPPVRTALPQARTACAL